MRTKPKKNISMHGHMLAEMYGDIWSFLEVKSKWAAKWTITQLASGQVDLVEQHTWEEEKCLKPHGVRVCCLLRLGSNGEWQTSKSTFKPSQSGPTKRAQRDSAPESHLPTIALWGYPNVKVIWAKPSQRPQFFKQALGVYQICCINAI